MKSMAVLTAILLMLVLLLSCTPEAEPTTTPNLTTTPAPEETSPPTPATESTPATEETPPQVETPPPPATTTITPPTPTYTPPPTIPTPSIVWTTPSTPVTLTVNEAAHSATYTSGGVQVSGYFYKPTGKGPFPAILVLHGKGGQNTNTRDRASWFAKQGYVAFAPDYFTPISMTAESFTVSFYSNSVDPAREVLGLGLEALKSLSYVEPNRLGVYGHSLGGYLSFILGTRDDVKGIVSCSGAYAPTAPARYPLTNICAEMKTAVLMFHCVPDALVPIDHANTASNLLISKGKQCEYIIYPDGGHVFDIPGGQTYSATATADFQQKMIAFLEAKLQ